MALPFDLQPRFKALYFFKAVYTVVLLAYATSLKYVFSVFIVKKVI